ncbi:MAG: D-alanyl-D-alanine carboxypeptidase [Clostridia bacterium]|nr:D-alanyl-D-alanine carboxypeptidase [Clostridia bacterium]
MRILKRIAVLILAFVLYTSCFESVSAATPDITSVAAVLIDAQTGQILFEKNKDEKLYPASITKIMTLYLAAQSENKELAIASENAIQAVPRDTSNIAIDYGEEFSLEQLMYAAQLMSANDACNVIAEHVSGSIEEFVKLMNKTARQMGTRNTNFANANGLMNENHYTSANDFALITQNAIKNKEFMKVFSEVEYSIPYTNKKQEMRNMVAQHRMMHWPKYENLGVVGGKAGFTTEAKHTLVTYAEKNGIKVIAVVLKAPDFATVYEDTEKLLNYAYNSLESVTISDSDITSETINYTTYTPKGEVTFWVDKDDPKEFTYAFSSQKVDVVAHSGTVMGSLDVEVDIKTPVWKIILYIFAWIIGIILAWIIFMYIVLIIRYNKKKRRRKALRKRYK